MTLFGEKYRFLEVALLCLSVLLLVRRFEMLPGGLEAPSFQLLVLNAAACLFMPSSIRLPFYNASLTYINLRLSLLSAVLFCAVIAAVRMHAVEKAVTAALLVSFFWFSYVDERALNSVERKMSHAIATLPLGARVIATVADAALLHPVLLHLLDRPCIGRCFDFANYEPATTQFRLRAKDGNPYVMTDIDDILALENTEYTWRTAGYLVIPAAALREKQRHLRERGAAWRTAGQATVGFSPRVVDGAIASTALGRMLENVHAYTAIS